TASLSKVIKIPPATPLLYAFYPGLTGARGITAGNDGRLWVADFGGQSVVSVTTGGVATPHPVGGGPQEVVAGLGGQVAYTNPGAVPQSIGRLEQGGTAQPTQTPLSDPFGITFGSDQAYWTAQFAANNLGRLTPDGQYTTLGGFSANSGPRYIAKGANNTLWVTLETINKVARVSGLEPPAPTPTADTTPPVITALSMSPSAFRVGAKSTPTIARRVPVGTKIRFMLSEASSVRLAIERALPGRRTGKTCVRPRKALRRKRKCTRYKRVGALQRQGATGKNSVSFSGRIGREALKPGRYRLIVTATDAAGNAGTANPKRFRVLAIRKQ
ncbi:MAG: hypothetical protein Q7R41_08360, partial [Phycisphaerales bacterium]|nr:hypothetical protein [Phycisphaerales bacterium]